MDNMVGLPGQYGQMYYPGQQQQSIMVPQAMPVRRWVKYYMQRRESNVVHVLFYVVDAQGFAKLAVVVSAAW